MASGQQDWDTQDEPERKKQNLEEDQKSSIANTGVSVNVNAETGGSVNAPVLTGNIITAPVTINYSTGGHEPRKISETEAAEKHTEKQDLILKKFLETHKANMKKKAECISEGKKENEANLQAVYTELFITVGDMKDVHQEHEILKIDDAINKKKQTEDKPIQCNDVFKLLEDKKKIVLTKGVSGIGKTVSVHKFILDWAEGKANQDIKCVFLLPFREINFMNDEDFSLHEFLLEFYPELGGLEKTNLYKESNIVFIFDGLDESHLPLNFNTRTSTRAIVEKRSSVDMLFTGLVKGQLLPLALVWVTSRPAAANQIPPQYVGLFTEVRGFTDQQKEEYFRKKITDETLASRIITHIKTSCSLYIMCHIPLFCWITATVLQDILIKNSEENFSTTLTEMYIHFLLIQMNIKSQKYDVKAEREYTKNLDSNRTMILKLAKLAFEELKKKNSVFYEKDLKACGIFVSKDTEFTGMITEIFKKEDGLHDKKVFSFMHLSVQEFLAAVHVFLCYLNKNMQELEFFFDKPEEKSKLQKHQVFSDEPEENSTLQEHQFFSDEPEENSTLQELQFFFDKPEEKNTLQGLLQKAVDKATESKRGHLDLFLRFLVGITLESSQNLLQGLITHTEDTTKSIRQTTQYIKQELNSYSISNEASVNLFYCLLELKDRSLYEEIQRYLSSDEHPGRKLSSSMCSVLTYILLMSEKVLDEFNPKRFTSSSNYKRLIPAVRCCRTALFDGCGLDETCCETVCSALHSSDSHLRELDLSRNHLQDSGVKLVYDGLKSSHCQLNILRLCGCNLTVQSCESLSLALQSSTSCLKELDLSNNDLNDSGVKLISDGLKSSHCQLEILRFSICNLTTLSCESLSSVLQSSNSFLKELDLSNNDLMDSGVKLISDGLKSSHCQLEILRLSGCMVTEEGCGYLSSALSSNPSHLRELDLSYNHPGDSGVKLLSTKLKNLNKLNVDHGEEYYVITEGLHKYSHQLTLDLNTMNTLLRLSNGDIVITHTDIDHQYPDHPDRFDGVPQVLCEESVCGRCYWELQWSGDVDISVSYKSIGRKGQGNECMFGSNDQSWSLCCSPYSYSFRHNNILTVLPVEPTRVYDDDDFRTMGVNEEDAHYIRSIGLYDGDDDYDNDDDFSRIEVFDEDIRRIGVYVDHSAGTLSFYSVSDSMSLIHSVQTTFTQPLYPGIRVGFRSSAKLCETGEIFYP
ncbi:NACHT, LRR and PYD domains-containing protein 12-like isoform X1 [Carassius carassius]|uniref:NACHT, LRR and PYD domains-containing protein 12-like isoform X1 n=1 Tax=Carassius carassius TaxID=217509 RepID=UPI002868E3C2|nr:NACHT, LRR and PYD domains-containing protein 12-like isoform X1 [Carassius carassius]